MRRQHECAARYLRLSISPTQLSKVRPGFGSVVRGARGAVVASPVLADYDPEPDYFYHWFRDSALVMAALHTLPSPESTRDFADFVDFSLALRRLDGRALCADARWREAVRDTHRPYLRDDAELARVHGEAVAAEARVQADGSLDFSRWARPQHDGPPLRLLAALRWWPDVEAELRGPLAELMHADLAFTRAHAAQPSYDIWEEELGEHYYNLRLSAAALRQAALWLAQQNQAGTASACAAQAAQLLRRLDDFYLAEADGSGYCRSRLQADGSLSAKALDVSVILAAIHAGEWRGAHTPADPRLQQTLARLERVFAQLLPINRHRGAGLRPALGRYPGDVYYDGGAWYIATLAAAEFCYRAAQGEARALWRAQGDEYLQTVRAYTPESGELSEQIDRDSGAPRSARHLAWSYAAFLSCVNAREALWRAAP
ncbi:glucoamylase [Solimonas aquatica]|uniref:glucan 1,4-alpha-glucosidase n=1 Tax=Solimonas aquatica TaxID=489703 RepID=A0A1H9GG73_9GAMM|nr:glucoamylase [Solimonas aquatica]